MMKMKKATITRLIAKLKIEHAEELNQRLAAYDKQVFGLCDANDEIKRLSGNKKEVKSNG